MADVRSSSVENELQSCNENGGSGVTLELTEVTESEKDAVDYKTPTSPSVAVSDSQNELDDDMEIDSGDEEDFENDAGDANEVTDNAAEDENKSNDEGKPEGLLGYKYKKVLKYNCPRASMQPLPEGWVMVSHTSGVPVYLHRKTRVVTWSRPYCLMTGYVMKHKVPIQSIPCLHYQKNKQKLVEWEKSVASIKTDVKSEDGTEKETDITGECVDNGEEAKKMKPPSADDSTPMQRVILHGQKDLCLDDDHLKEYLERRFEFETLKIPQFKKWSHRRDFIRNEKKKKLEDAKRNSSQDAKSGDDANEDKVGSAKLITFTVEQEDGAGGVARNKKFVLNMNGKPMICILHEYAQRVLKVQPKYTFNVREDSAEPFEATIKLNDKVYGTAVAINKKTAKNKAALTTLEMLIPDFKGKVQSASEPPDMEYFNEVSITDSRVYELCIHTGQLLPYHLLMECLKRNQGITDTTTSFDVQQGKRKSLNYTMKCGKHTVNGVAKNKKIAKQIASQQILQLLHPKVKTWAELIGLYGKSLAQERARRKQAEQEIFDLKQRRGNFDDEATAGKSQSTNEDQNSLEPNPELLAKLKDMMLKLEKSRKRKRKVEEEEAAGAREKKPSPMAAAVAAGMGMLAVPEGSECDTPKEDVEMPDTV